LPEAVWGLADLAHNTVVIVGVGREGQAITEVLQAGDSPPHMVAIDGVEGDHAARFRARWGDTVPLVILEGEESPIPPSVARATVAVVSPGVAPTNWLHRWVSALGIPLTTSSALFVADHHQSMVGITGSKGKSTVTTLIHQLLEASGEKASLGGNMGIPLQGLEPQDRQVVELSSYQCHYLQVSPDVVVLSALFPEHLDWHGDTEAYFAAKLSLVSHQPRIVIANGDDAILRAELTKRYPDVSVEWVGEGFPWHLEVEGEDSWLCHGTDRLFRTRESALLGVHNHRNMLLALAGAAATGALDTDAIAPVLSAFPGLAHRLEKIGDPSGVVFVNDSLATNPHAAAAALVACSSPGMVWLVGGFDRGVNYQVLIEQVVRQTPRHIVGLPESGPRLVELFREALTEAGRHDQVSLHTASSMLKAVTYARGLAEPGDYVVLSPGAPSFGIYRDYQHRADDFRSAIEHTQTKDTA